MRSWTTAAAFALCLAILVAPVALSAYPPLVDYPSHLARLFILTHPDDQFLAGHYRIDWRLLPNLGFDLTGYALAQAMPVEAAGRVFLAATVAVTFSAPMALHWAFYGRLSVLPLLAGPLVFHRALQMGFLSYCMGVGLAILGFAAWIALRARSPLLRFAVLQAIALVLSVWHLYALGILGVLVTLSAVSEAWRGEQSLARAVLPALLVFVLPGLLLLSGAAGSGATATLFPGLAQKLVMLPLALVADLTAANFALALAALSPAVIAWIGGARAVHPAAAWPLAALFLLYWALPDRLMTSQNADWRLLLPAALVLAGAAADPFRSPRAMVTLAAAAIAVNLGAAYLAQAAWRAGDSLRRDLAAVLAELPEEQVLSPYPSARTIREGFLPPSAFHAAAYAVIWRRAFVPSVFAHPGQQPIALAEPDGPGAGWQAWLDRGARTQPDAALLESTQGYVLGIRAPGEPPGDLALPVSAEEITTEGRFTLYRLAESGG